MAEIEASVLDLAYLRGQTAGDAELERDLLALLLSQCASLLPLLVSPDDETRRREAAHSLRGAAAALGARRLASAAAEIEAGREPTIAIGQIVGEVREAIGRLLERGAA